MGVPKIIHQIWFDFSKDGSGRDPPKKYSTSKEYCERINCDWVFKLWNERDCLELVKTEYPEYLEMYQNYKYPIQKVDAAKYFILHAYGGVYMDMDMQCRKPLNIKGDGVFLVEVNTISKYNNAFIASSPREPFWQVVFQLLKKAQEESSIKNLNLNWLTIFNTTGPYILDSAAKQMPVNSLPVDLYEACDWCGNVSNKDYYVIHHSDNNWTTSFEKVVVKLWCLKSYIIILLSFIIILIIIGVLYIKLK